MGRRSNKEGSYWRMKSGNWIGQIMDGYTPEGKRNVVNFTAPTKGEAQQKVRQYLADREAGRLAKSEKMPFDQWARAWYRDYEGEVEESTYANYRYTLNTIIAHFGDKSVAEIRQMDVNAFLKKLSEEGFSRSKISKCKAMLIQIFDAAEANELVLRNPAIRAKAKKSKKESGQGKEKKDAFSEGEVQLLREKLPNNLMGNSILSMIGTGLRTQELLALTPEDIAEDGSQITVDKAIKMVNGNPTLGVPKSKRSRRIIPVPQDYRGHVKRMRELGGKAFIWASSRSNLLYDVGTFRRQYYRALDKVPGVRRLSPHCCRHTYITRLEAKGVPMTLIARLAGHSKVETTVEYTHTELSTLAEAVAVLNGAGKEGA